MRAPGEVIIAVKSVSRRKPRKGLLEADSLQHSFAVEDSMTLQEYIDRNLALNNDAGELDKDAMVQRLMFGADPALAKLTEKERFIVYRMRSKAVHLKDSTTCSYSLKS